MIPADFPDMIRDIYNRLAEQDRRLSGMRRTGTVADINYDEGLARVEIGKDPVTGEPMLSPWVPWEEPTMGDIRWHIPPKLGEQVRLNSDTGDIADARIAVGSTPSNDFKRPHNKGGEHVRTVGNFRQLEKDGQSRLSVGDASIDVTPDKITITCGDIVLVGNVHLGGEGGKLVHRKGDDDSGGDIAVGSASKVYAV